MLLPTNEGYKRVEAKQEMPKLKFIMKYMN